MNNKRKIGTEYEQIASDYLKMKGFEIVENNFYSRHCEIDIIAKDKEVIVFVEVKYRRDDHKGSPLEAINYRKKNNIIRAAKYYLHKNYYGQEVTSRFDVVSIEGDEISLIKDAFWIN